MVDREKMVAHVQGGCKLADFDAETNAQGFVAVAGSDPRTGVGGYVQGGGWGWLSRKYGMSCDSLVEAECVLADGTVVIANEKEHADLFWAIRGAGASFGVMCRYTMKLRPMPKVVLAGQVGFVFAVVLAFTTSADLPSPQLLYPEEKGKEALLAVRDHIKAAPREVATMWELNWSPPNTGKTRRPFAQIMPIYLGDDEAEGRKILQPICEAVPNPFNKGRIGKMPYSTLQSMLVQYIQPSFRSETAVFVPEITQELVDILFDQFLKSPLPGTFIAVFPFGGAVGDKEPGETAFPWRLKSGWLEVLGGFGSFSIPG